MEEVFGLLPLLVINNNYFLIASTCLVRAKG
ncbi:hypothetical protein M2419_004542 [Sphingobacterium sp. BIGb0116]|nr:hypothetical protein [Sphingobacterium sp. BIGb0116]